MAVLTGMYTSIGRLHIMFSLSGSPSRNNKRSFDAFGIPLFPVHVSKGKKNVKSTWTKIKLTFFRFAHVSTADTLQACSLGSFGGLSTRRRTRRIGPLWPHWTHFCKASNYLLQVALNVSRYMSIVTPTTSFKTATARWRKTAIYFVANLFITWTLGPTNSRFALIMVTTVTFTSLTFLEWSATTFRPC